jgi:hypothetical protein
MRKGTCDFNQVYGITERRRRSEEEKKRTWMGRREGAPRRAYYHWSGVKKHSLT